MRPQKVEDQELLKGMMTVLSAKGYDGASLNELAESSGLQKASLYHRFPDGKKEITSAVLNYVNDWIHANIYQLLSNHSIDVTDRLSMVVKNINSLYNNGDAICILRALTMETGVPVFDEQIKNSFQLWIKGFTCLGVDLGMTEKVAREKAIRVLVLIQGSLIVARGIGSIAIYKSTIKEVEAIYRE